jgi:hypothetical protein
MYTKYIKTKIISFTQCYGYGSGGFVINWPPGHGNSELLIRVCIHFQIRILIVYQDLKNLRKLVQYFTIFVVYYIL